MNYPECIDEFRNKSQIAREYFGQPGSEFDYDVASAYLGVEYLNDENVCDALGDFFEQQQIARRAGEEEYLRRARQEYPTSYRPSYTPSSFVTPTSSSRRPSGYTLQNQSTPTAILGSTREPLLNTNRYVLPPSTVSNIPTSSRNLVEEQEEEQLLQRPSRPTQQPQYQQLRSYSSDVNSTIMTPNISYLESQERQQQEQQNRNTGGISSLVASYPISRKRRDLQSELMEESSERPFQRVAFSTQLDRTIIDKVVAACSGDLSSLTTGDINTITNAAASYGVDISNLPISQLCQLVLRNINTNQTTSQPTYIPEERLIEEELLESEPEYPNTDISPFESYSNPSTTSSALTNISRRNRLTLLPNELTTPSALSTTTRSNYLQSNPSVNRLLQSNNIPPSLTGGNERQQERQLVQQLASQALSSNRNPVSSFTSSSSSISNTPMTPFERLLSRTSTQSNLPF